jgi:putative ubiquitin-RnfH superfamily antitoxin RatB of RatAB toxin-antitoxin module
MTLAVTVAYAGGGIELILPVVVDDGATVADALAASRLHERVALLPSIGYAIFGQAARPDTPLADGDRVEVTRPLVADAKAIRRTRAAGHPLPRTRKVKRKQR